MSEHLLNMASKSWVAVVLAGVLLAGCQTTPQTPRSTVELLGSTADETPTSGAWWQQFADPQLSQLIEKSSQSNRDVQIAMTRLAQAQAGFSANQSRLLPTVSLNGSASDSQSDLPAAVKQGKPDTRAVQLYADLKWELDVFGSNRAATQAAQAQAAAAAWGITGAQLLVMGEVARQYMLWQGATERLRVLGELINNQNQTLERTKNLKKEGMASDFDISRVNAELANTQSLLPSLRTLQALSLHRLSVLVGDNPAAPSFVLTAKPAASWPKILQWPVQQQATLLKRRPDIRAAEQQLMASSAARASALADRYPKLFVNAVWGEQKLALNGFQLAASPYQQVAMMFAAPIFNRAQINANIEIKTAQQQEALLHYDQTIVQAIEQVENALVATRQEQQRTQSLQHSLAARQTALKHAKSLYQEGQTGVLPVLDVERSLISTSLNVIDSQQQNSLNLIQLYTAMGGGWDQLPNPMHSTQPSSSSVVTAGAPTP